LRNEYATGDSRGRRDNIVVVIDHLFKNGVKVGVVAGKTINQPVF
jgi:hypothetical protein